MEFKFRNSRYRIDIKSLNLSPCDAEEWFNNHNTGDVIIHCDGNTLSAQRVIQATNKAVDEKMIRFWNTALDQRFQGMNRAITVADNVPLTWFGTSKIDIP